MNLFRIHIRCYTVLLTHFMPQPLGRGGGDGGGSCGNGGVGSFMEEKPEAWRCEIIFSEAARLVQLLLELVWHQRP